jgi:hypothetical protein
MERLTKAPPHSAALPDIILHTIPPKSRIIGPTKFTENSKIRRENSPENHHFTINGPNHFLIPHAKNKANTKHHHA